MQRDWRQVEPQQVIPIRRLRNKGIMVDRWVTTFGEIGHTVVEDVDGNFWEYTDWVSDTQAVLVERVSA